MTRAVPVSHYRRKNAKAVQQEPKPGSSLANCYHALRRGETVTAPFSVAFDQLRDFYGMEIESSWHGSRLLGEWDGPIYLTLEQVMAQEQARDLETVDAQRAT